MSSITTITNELRLSEMSLKDEGKVLRMISAKANAERRQPRGGAIRVSLNPRVLRRSDAEPAPQA